jgi:hypothetical protein
MSWIRNTARSKGWAKADLYGVLCLALGELCRLGGPEEGAQVQARQLGHVSQLLCGASREPWKQWDDSVDFYAHRHLVVLIVDVRTSCQCYHWTGLVLLSPAR